MRRCFVQDEELKSPAAALQPLLHTSWRIHSKKEYSHGTIVPRHSPAPTGGTTTGECRPSSPCERAAASPARRKNDATSKFKEHYTKEDQKEDQYVAPCLFRGDA